MARHTALKLLKYPQYWGTIAPQLVLHDAHPPPLPMCNRVVPCCKNTILSHFIQFQHYGEKDTLAYREMKLLLPGGSGAGGIINWGGRVQNHFSDLKIFFEIQFKNILNLIFPSFKVSSKSSLFKDLKTGLTFWHMWFFNFQNLVRRCQHIDGTPCIWYRSEYLT